MTMRTLAAVLWLTGGLCMASYAQRPTCLVLAEGYVSEYAWARYRESQFPIHHPGYDFLIRGLTDHAQRFSRWLEDWEVRRTDLERLQGPLDLSGVDLVILDEVASPCVPRMSRACRVRPQGGRYRVRRALGPAAARRPSTVPQISSYGRRRWRGIAGEDRSHARPQHAAGQDRRGALLSWSMAPLRGIPAKPGNSWRP